MHVKPPIAGHSGVLEPLEVTKEKPGVPGPASSGHPARSRFENDKASPALAASLPAPALSHAPLFRISAVTGALVQTTPPPSSAVETGLTAEQRQAMQDSIGLQQSILRGDFDRAYAGNGTDVEAAKKTAAALIEKLTAALSGAPAAPVAETDVSKLAPVVTPPPAGPNRPASWAQWPNQQGLMTDPGLRQTFAKDDPFYLPPGDYGTGKAARDRIMLPVAGQFQTYAFSLDSGAATQGVPVSLKYDTKSFANFPDSVLRGDVAQMAAPLIRAAFEQIDAKALGLKNVAVKFVNTPGASKPSYERNGDTVTMSADFQSMKGLYDSARYTTGEAYTGMNDFIGEYNFELRGLSMGGKPIRGVVNDFASALRK